MTLEVQTIPNKKLIKTVESKLDLFLKFSKIKSVQIKNPNENGKISCPFKNNSMVTNAEKRIPKNRLEIIFPKYFFNNNKATNT